MLTNPATLHHRNLLAAWPGAILDCMTRGTPSAVGIMLFVSLVLLSARADELKLKDGTKISGTIVGFEDNSFKVRTSYGFAIVEKDQVVSINIADTTKKPEADKKPEIAGEKAPVPAKPAKTEIITASASASAQPPPSANKPVAAPATPSTVTPAPALATTTANHAAPPAAVAPAAVTPAPQPKPAAPEPMREEVNGNMYMNDTYGFRMYKPPAWQLIAGAPTILPGAITAMGTADETTYLLIGQEPAAKSLQTNVDATEQRLREIMDNFRPLGEKHITVSGLDAIEHRFRGSVDQHDWSGTVVFVPRGGHLYTIFGMTYADTDLVQIQENVIARTISSLQFTK